MFVPFDPSGEIEIYSLPPYERLALCSLARDSTTLAHNQMPKRRHSSFTSQFQYWKIDDTLMLFESHLMNFMEGVEVLRELSESTRELRELINLQRTHLQELQYDPNFVDSQSAITFISALIKLTKGEEECYNFDNFISKCDQSLPSFIEYLTHYLNGIVSVFDLNASIISSLLPHFMKSSSLSTAILRTFDACLHEAIISCFESIDLLVPNFDVPLERSGQNENPLPVSHHIPDEVSQLLQQLASLREENQTFSYEFHPPSTISTAYQETQQTTNTSYEVSDWVTYYDESSGRYYLYSESLGESKWLDPT